MYFLNRFDVIFIRVILAVGIGASAFVLTHCSPVSPSVEKSTFEPTTGKLPTPTPENLSQYVGNTLIRGGEVVVKSDFDEQNFSSSSLESISPLELNNLKRNHGETSVSLSSPPKQIWVVMKDAAERRALVNQAAPALQELQVILSKKESDSTHIYRFRLNDRWDRLSMDLIETIYFEK